MNLETFVIEMTKDGWIPGREIRRILNHGKWFWQRWSGPRFYAEMAKLENQGRVVSCWEERVVDGHTVRERVYRLAE